MLSRSRGDSRLGRDCRRRRRQLILTSPALTLIADHREQGPHLNDVSLVAEPGQKDPGTRRRDNDGRLRGLDLDEVLVELELIANVREPLPDLRLAVSITDARQSEFEWHSR